MLLALGVVASLVLAPVALWVTAVATYDQGYVGGFYFIWFAILTLLTAPVGLLLWHRRRWDLRALAVGLLIGWAGGGRGMVRHRRIPLDAQELAVVAFDARTSRRMWASEFEDANGASTPATAPGLVSVQIGRSFESVAGTLAGLDADTGRRL